MATRIPPPTFADGLTRWNWSAWAATLQPISPGKHVVHCLGHLAAAFSCYIGLIWAALHPRQQGGQERIGGAVVVHGSRARSR